jgi:hypothetical protein
MKRLMILTLFTLLGWAPGAQAITLAQAQAEADTWLGNQFSALQAEIEACLARGTYRLCHPVLSTSNIPNTLPADPALATVTHDDPGVFTPSPCDPGCYDDTRNTFALAQVDIPPTGPVALSVNFLQGRDVFGYQIVGWIRYDGTLYRRMYGFGANVPNSPWAAIVQVP